jgi:hypothetical protein
VFWYCRSGTPLPRNAERLTLRVPNLSGHFAGALRRMWDSYGLGSRCLLVSESRAVAAVMRERYPTTDFLSSNLHPELFGPGDGAAPDFEWDVLEPPAAALEGQFSSVISHALLEHVIDPVTTFKNMVAALWSGGFLYVMTVMPSFHLHRYPRDYVRFHLDWFEDIGGFVGQREAITVQLESLWAHEGVVCACWQKITEQKRT